MSGYQLTAKALSEDEGVQVSAATSQAVPLWAARELLEALDETIREANALVQALGRGCISASQGARMIDIASLLLSLGPPAFVAPSPLSNSMLPRPCAGCAM
jgi:hypothetical protein